MRKLAAMLVLLIVITPLLTSCYDAREIDDLAYVLAFGIDKGVSNKWRFSFQIPLMEASTGGEGQSGGGKSPGYSTITVDAPSFFAAVNLVNSSIPRTLNFMHAKYIVFSLDAAQEGLIGTFVAPLIRYREIRRTTKLIVTKGTAHDFLEENISFIGTKISKSQEGLIAQAQESGFFPSVDLNNVYQGILATYRQPIAILGGINHFKTFKEFGEKWPSGKPAAEIRYEAGQMPRKGGNKVELLGCALGDGEKIIALLDAYETRILSMARGEFKRGAFTLVDPKSPEDIIAIDMRQARKAKVKVSFENEKPIIRLSVFLEGDVVSIQSRADYENLNQTPILETAVEKEVKGQLDALTKKCKALDSDVFNFGTVAVRGFATIPEWEAYDWNKHFKDAVVITEVKFKVRRTGTMIRSAPAQMEGGNQ